MATKPRYNIGPGNVGISQSFGNGGYVGASANPIKGNVGVRAGSNIGGTSSASIGAGYNLTKGEVGVSPRITIGNSGAAQAGSQVGGIAGDILLPGVGGAVGSAVGSSAAGAFSENPRAAGASVAMGLPPEVGTKIAPAVTSGAKKIGNAIGFKSGGDKGHNNRNKFQGQLMEAGVYGSDGMLQLPDGTTANFLLDGQEGKHTWKNGDKRVDDKAGDRDLYAYETDYTNDMDYISSMGGISLARLLGGSKNKEIDQNGQRMGNQALGKVGYGAEFSEDNFKSVMGNTKAMYANAGIKSKEEMLSLANKAYSEGRINEADMAVMQQTAGLVFDTNYDMASKLMQGRWPGIETANQTPANNSEQNTVYAPQVAGSEAISSFQRYLQMVEIGKPMSGGAVQKGGSSNTLAIGLALAAGVFGAGVGSGGKKPGTTGTTTATKPGTKAEPNSVATWLGGLIKSGVGEVRGLYEDVMGNSPENIDRYGEAYNDAYDKVDSGIFAGNYSGSDLAAAPVDPGSNGFDYSEDDTNWFGF